MVSRKHLTLLSWKCPRKNLTHSPNLGDKCDSFCPAESKERTLPIYLGLGYPLASCAPLPLLGMSLAGSLYPYFKNCWRPDSLVYTLKHYLIFTYRITIYKVLLSFHWRDETCPSSHVTFLSQTWLNRFHSKFSL